MSNLKSRMELFHLDTQRVAEVLPQPHFAPTVRGPIWPNFRPRILFVRSGTGNPSFGEPKRKSHPYTSPLVFGMEGVVSTPPRKPRISAPDLENKIQRTSRDLSNTQSVPCTSRAFAVRGGRLNSVNNIFIYMCICTYV